MILMCVRRCKSAEKRGNVSFQSPKAHLKIKKIKMMMMMKMMMRAVGGEEGPLLFNSIINISLSFSYFCLFSLFYLILIFDIFFVVG